MRKENCPYAYREGNGMNVLCQKIAEIPNAKWKFCAHQYMCRQTGRWEATKLAGECKYRKKQTIEKGE